MNTTLLRTLFMQYKNARDVLPDRLLKELQQYVSGETIYIPRSDEDLRKN